MGRMSTEKRQAEDTRRFCESVMVESWTGINPDWLDSGDPAERAKVAEWLESPDRGDPRFAEHAKAEREVVKYLTNWHKRARLMDWWRGLLSTGRRWVLPIGYDVHTPRLEYTMSASNWGDKAKENAQEMFEEFRDQMTEQLVESGEASTDLFNDYSGADEFHHQENVDEAYSLTDAAAVLDELDEFEETDTGLWHGLQPREAISVQAAYTFGNAVHSLWRGMVESLNEDVEAFEFDDDEDRARFLSWWLPARWVLDDLDGKECGGLVAAARAAARAGDAMPFNPLADWMRENPTDSASYKLPAVLAVLEKVEQAARGADEAAKAAAADE